MKTLDGIPFDDSLNIYTDGGVRVENDELWKRLRRIVQSFRIRVEVKWVKGHKTSVHNRAPDKLAKQSAAMPFDRPLSVSQTARKWSGQNDLPPSAVPSKRRKSGLKA